MWSWGWGVHGQLGVGSIEDVLLPTHIAGLDECEITQLAAGYSHSAVLSAKVFFCLNVKWQGSVFRERGKGTCVMCYFVTEENVFLNCGVY